MTWSEESVLRLRGLWDQGLSTAEIGNRLGVSPNAVVGKAHRLDLAARPSPIRREPTDGSMPKETPRKRATNGELRGSTLPPLPSTDGSPSIEKLTVDSTTIEPVTAVLEPPAVMIPAIPEPAPPSTLIPKRTGPKSAQPAVRLRTIPCQWPIGEPGKKDFRFCDDASIPGKSYCEEHVKLAYVKFQDRREDAT